jgi:purine-cytosine permease-like protein
LVSLNPALLFRRHLYSAGFKLTKIAAIIAVLSVGLLPVLISVFAPKNLGMIERIMIWLGGIATIFTSLFLFLRAKVWKKS